MELTPREILKVKGKTPGVNIVPDSPLYKVIISAMKYYSKQEVSKALKNPSGQPEGQ